MLKLTDLCVSYGKKQVLYDINMELKQGIYGLLGENGAGKTTLLSAIVGLMKIDRGDVLWEGKSIKSLKNTYYNYIGFLPQISSFYDEFYPLDFMYYMSELKGLKKDKYKQKAEELLEFVGLSQEKNKKIAAFSGGMKQRLGIAQTLINDPKLLIFDEPTAGLDPRERIRFRNIISELSKDKVVILATHIISDIENISDEIIILSKGRIVKRGTCNVIVEELNGMVYEAIVDDTIYSNIEKEKISNVVYINRGENASYKVRGFLGEIESSISVTPNLEDAFLYYITHN